MTTNIIDAEVIEDIELDTPLTPRQQHIKELRMMLDVLEANKDFPMPHAFGGTYDRTAFFPGSATTAANLVKALGGKWTKNDPNASASDAEYLKMEATLGQELNVIIYVSREGICEKKVIGTEKKKVKKVVVEQVTEEVYEDVDVIKFECKSLMSLAEQQIMDELEAAAS